MADNHFDPTLPPEFWKWQCATCTLLNEPGADRCSICNTLRGRQDGTTASLTPPPQPMLSLSPASPPPSVASLSAAPAAPVAAVRAGLSPEERRMREEEMRLKRRKKEDEQLKIRQQFEADRDARSPVVNTAHPAPAPLPSVSAPTAVAAATQLTARLQIRCPSLNRTVTCTAFSPESTLGDVREFLRSELLQGLQGGGANTRLAFDDELPEARALSEEQRAARDAREQFRQQTERLLQQAAEVRQSVVPPAEQIALRLAIPPRTRYVTPQDMALTLRAAGLCPSGTLIMESVEGAAGVGPAAAPGAAPPVAAAGRSEYRPPIEHTDPAMGMGDSEDDDDDENGPLGQAPMIGAGMDGRGGGFGMQGMPQRQYGGSAGAQWRFGNRPIPQRAHEPFVGPNGELVDPKQAGGSASGGAAQPQTAGGTATSQTGETTSQDRRAAALAALERRNAVPAPAVVQAPAAPAVPAYVPTSAIGAPPPDQARMGTKKQKDAEQKALMARIAAERAEYQELRAKPPVAASATAPTSAAVLASEGDTDEKRQAREARLRALEQRQGVMPSPAATATSPAAAAAAPGPVSAAASPAAGQTGMKKSKKEREEEKSRILQEMEEDRARYRDIHDGGIGPGAAPPAVSSQPAAPQQAQRMLMGAASTSDTVRITVRCAESGRSITTTAFAPRSLLQDVRAFAASELRGLAEDAAKELDVAAPFARIVFGANGDEMGKTLADLSLCPSATLILQKPGCGQAGADAPRAPVEPEPVSMAEERPEDIARKQEARERQAAAVAARLTGGSGQAAASSADPAQLAVPSSNSASAPASSAADPEICSIRLRMPDGAVRRLRIARDLPARAILEQLQMDLAPNDDMGEWVLLVPFPRRVLSGQDLALSLADLDLWPQGTLVVQHQSQQGQVRQGGASGARQQPGAMQDDEFRAWMDSMDWSEEQGEQNLRTDKEMQALNAKLTRFAFEEPRDEGGAGASCAEWAAAYGPTESAHDRTDRAVCSICCSEYVAGDQLSALPCTHVFHEECLQRWLRRSGKCCLCKASLC